ncbi:AAA family ATPase [Clostridium sp. BSD9I1]|uniref:AAA family ATPase n=1 Tax=Clostridium sp. BSD9I1 TaxID=2003589 RepID=UPI001647129D|nr:AAA family ATPase [Clostridium sp. BSD9I1]
MILKYLYVKNYKKFKDIEIKFYDYNDRKNNKLMDRIYENINLTVFVGENGAGKTTILSFITHVFKNLQRFHNRIPSDFKIIYSTEKEQCEDIIIEKIEQEIFFSINGRKKLLLEFDGKTKTYIGEKSERTITYDDIQNKLPTNIIVSYFDVDYPNDYNWNYIGHKLLKVKSIDKLYTSTGFGMDISKGIIEFFIKYFYKNDDLKNFFISLGFKFLEYLYVYRNFDFNENEKYEIFEEFYEEEGFNNWEEFLRNTSFHNEYDFIDYVMSENFWSDYCDNTIIIDDESDISFSYNEKLNFKKFIEGSFFNVSLLYRLVSKKKIFINEFFIEKDNEILSLYKMSTGEKIFLCRLFYLLSTMQDGSLIILEEPEIHLNYSWVKQLITVINLLFNEYRVHFLISTHNHAFINMLFPENILILEEGDIKHPNFNTFLANEREINRKLFKSSNTKNNIEKKILSMIDMATKEELEEIMSNLGESYFKYEVFKRLNEIGDENVEDNK